MVMHVAAMLSSNAFAAHTMFAPGAKGFMINHVLFPFLLSGQGIGQAAGDWSRRDGLRVVIVPIDVVDCTWYV